MFGHVAKCSSSFEIWKMLYDHFIIESKARTTHLRNLPQTTRKESMTINEFVLKVKSYVDSLFANGVQLTNEELIAYILDGLGPEYDVVSVHLSSRGDEVTLQEPQFLLHKHEIRLERYNSCHVNLHENLAYVARKQLFFPAKYNSVSYNQFPGI